MWERVAQGLVRDFLDGTSMSLAFFVLSSLDLLMATDKTATTDRRAWINWIYEQQCAQGGFSGSPSLRIGEVSRVLLCGYPARFICNGLILYLTDKPGPSASGYDLYSSGELSHTWR